MSPQLRSPHSLVLQAATVQDGSSSQISLSSSTNFHQYDLKYSYSFFPGSRAEYLWVWMCHGDTLLTPTAALEKLSLRKAESVLVAEQSGVAMDCCAGWACNKYLWGT